MNAMNYELVNESDSETPINDLTYKRTRTCSCKWVSNSFQSTSIVCAQLKDFYPNHITESTELQYICFTNPVPFVSLWLICASTCVSFVFGPIARVVTFTSLQFTIPSMWASICSMTVKLMLMFRLEPLVQVYYLSKFYDSLVIMGVALLFVITCTPYDYIVNPDTMARERDTPHNRNGREVMSLKFTFLPFWVLMSAAVLVRFVRLNLSMVYERRTFKNRNCKVILLRKKEYRKLRRVPDRDVSAWFQKLDNYIGRFGTLMVWEIISFGISFVSLTSSLLLDGFLGPIDTCLAFTSVLLFLPSLFFIMEFSRINKAVSVQFDYKYVGDGNVYTLSYAEIKVLGGLLITIAGALLNIKII